MVMATEIFCIGNTVTTECPIFFPREISSLQMYYSEYALIRYYIQISLYYFQDLIEKIFRVDISKKLCTVMDNLCIFDIPEIKQCIVSNNNNIIKGITEYTKKCIEKCGLSEYVNYYTDLTISLGDVNNVYLVSCVRDSIQKLFLPELEKISESDSEIDEYTKKLKIHNYTAQFISGFTDSQKFLKKFFKLESKKQNCENNNLGNVFLYLSKINTILMNKYPKLSSVLDIPTCIFNQKRGGNGIDKHFNNNKTIFIALSNTLVGWKKIKKYYT